MALDRSAIERTDFPVARRGYEPEAVRAHLGRIADEVERLRSAATPLATAAGDRVAAIVEAAEKTAGEIRRQAEAEAAGMREDASAQAREDVARVIAATRGMRERIHAIEGELERLQATLGELTPAPAEPAASPVRPQVAARETAPPPVPAEPAATAPVQEEEPVTRPARNPDVEGARIVALSMALEGTSREETDAYLAEHYELPDRDGLLDEVYASV